MLILIGCFALLFFYHKRNSQKYPRLYAFGMQDWLIHCEGQNREYRLLSENDSSTNSMLSPTSRDLSFLDKNNKNQHYIKRFDFKSLDQDSVWRFYYTKDIRLFAKKNDTSKVLWGDEQVFEISPNLTALTVTTESGRKIKLACQRKR